jgi:cell division protein FtsL
MKKVSRKKRITKGEIGLYLLIAICFVSTFVMKIFCGASIANLSMSVEKIRYEIDSQDKTNESLVMKVNELTSFDKIKDVVNDMGLAYNNDNVIVINN